jgi:hypothetical protein
VDRPCSVNALQRSNSDLRDWRICQSPGRVFDLGSNCAACPTLRMRPVVAQLKIVTIWVCDACRFFSAPSEWPVESPRRREERRSGRPRVRANVHYPAAAQSRPWFEHRCAWGYTAPPRPRPALGADLPDPSGGLDRQVSPRSQPVARPGGTRTTPKERTEGTATPNPARVLRVRILIYE